MDWCTSHIWSAYEYWHVSTSAKTYVLSAGEIGSLRTLDFHFLSHLQLRPQFSILWDTDIYFYKCSSIWYQHSISYMLKVRFCINKDAQLYAELKKVWVIIQSWEDMPVFTALVVWGWFSQEWSSGCRVSRIHTEKLSIIWTWSNKVA